MVKIKPIDQIVSRWVQGVRGATQAYQFGVSNPQRDWAEATLAGATAWFQGLQAAHAAGRFEGGVRAAGSIKWKNRTLTRGVQVWPVAVAAAEGDFRAGYSPFREAIAAATLPTKYPKRDPRNLERVAAIDRIMMQTADARGTGTPITAYAQPSAPQIGGW
ncbi:MAG: hypothetical protein HWN68_15000 [Desulfobacterales bacterium]|nr:hypothetical protein [Desulfobacterales bacterium]